MFTTLVAVVAALVLGHVAPAPVASLRRFHWWARWLDWIGTHAGEGGFWQGRSGLWLALPFPARAAGLALFAAAGVAVLWPLIRFRWPTRTEALGRLDRGTGIRHRPATALSEPLGRIT